MARGRPLFILIIVCIPPPSRQLPALSSSSYSLLYPFCSSPSLISRFLFLLFPLSLLFTPSLSFIHFLSFPTSIPPCTSISHPFSSVSVSIFSHSLSYSLTNSIFFLSCHSSVIYLSRYTSLPSSFHYILHHLSLTFFLPSVLPPCLAIVPSLWPFFYAPILFHLLSASYSSLLPSSLSSYRFPCSLSLPPSFRPISLHPFTHRHINNDTDP